MKTISPENLDSWRVGRAGMLYRDLTPDSLKEKVVVSHIRLPFDGEVPDYVHYHKIDFQMIYCLKGRILVVYEDQGPPFWLERRDCVVQPPEIRHRVLECEADSEVIELTTPAEHETWMEHDMKLPTAELRPERIFKTQPFLRLRATNFDAALVTIAEKMPIGHCIDPLILNIGETIQNIIISDRLQEPSV